MTAFQGDRVELLSTQMAMVIRRANGAEVYLKKFKRSSKMKEGRHVIKGSRNSCNALGSVKSNSHERDQQWA
jgi:hypothetical protein